MKKKILSIILSVSILVSSAAAFAAPSDVPFEERPLTVDMVKVDTAIENLKKDLEKPNNYEKVFEDYKTLIDLSAEVFDTRQLNFAEIEKLNYDFEGSYDREQLNADFDTALEYGNRIDLAIKSILDSQYADRFRGYWGEERTEQIESIDGETNKAYKDFHDRYYELLDKNAESIEFAKLLKGIITYSIESGNVATGEETTAYGVTMEQQWKYCNDMGNYYYYVNKFKNYGTHCGFTDIEGDIDVQNPLEALSFVGKIDSKLKSAYEYMVRNNLCFWQKNDEKYTGSTYWMNHYDDSEVVVSSYDVISTLIHEFGHFQSHLNNETDNEDGYFGERTPLVEFDSQMLELLAMDYYDEIYDENADAMRFYTLVSSLQGIGSAANLTACEMTLYSKHTLEAEAEEIDLYLKNAFGDEWYKNCEFYFTNPGTYIRYSLTMFAAAQVYDLYLRDKNAGVEKYFEACSYIGGTYDEVMKSLGLVSAFDENAVEYLQSITDNIFKTEYAIDYATALDYFENGTYLGTVYPTAQRVSVNGGEPQSLFAYNSGGYNYIRIRDLARLLSGTAAQFDVEYDEETFTVNIISGKPYTPDGTAMEEIPEVETAGQKAAGTSALLCDGKQVSAGGQVFVNGWNCYLLRGLAERGVFDITVDYDEENDVVLIYTE